MFGSKTISKRFTVLERVIQVRRHFLNCKPLDICVLIDLQNEAQVDLPSPTHCTNGYFRLIVAFSEQVIASITYDSRSGISVVAFCTAKPTGGLSCLCTNDYSVGILA